jgi:hypothetical protein
MMADSVVEDEILSVLREGEPIMVDADSQFREAAGLTHFSNRQVKSALSHCIETGNVKRCRREPYSLGDTERPITFIYSGPDAM